jgi:uncharacterized membrane protein
MPRRRLISIDLLRGVVMVLMALDHARDYFGFTPVMPENLESHDSAALFLTRWVTHFCAPVFVLLAGTSAWLWARAGARERTRRDLSWFLLSRGAWLIVLELTLVRWAWFLMNLSDWDYSWFFVQVIWALGWSMVALAGLVWLPRWAVAAVGIGMIAGHNLLDGIDAASLGRWSGLWKLLHQPSGFDQMRAVIWPLGGKMLVAYPLVPWIGVMAMGYALGPVMLMEARARRRALVGLGLAMVAAFLLLRAMNSYGDPRAWQRLDGRGPLWTAFSFVNCEKYPPSFCFLLMTLGPALVALGLMATLDKGPGAAGTDHKGGGAERQPIQEPVRESWVARFFVTFGRVPLFFYVLHLLVLQVSAAIVMYARYGDQLFEWTMPPPDVYVGLWPVYAAWAGAVAILFPVCRWFEGVKARNRGKWWVGYV